MGKRMNKTIICFGISILILCVVSMGIPVAESVETVLSHKEYTVSSKTRAYQKLVGFRLKSADEVEIRAEVKRNSTEFAVIEGRLSQYKQTGSDVFLYTFRLKKRIRRVEGRFHAVVTTGDQLVCTGV